MKCKVTLHQITQHTSYRHKRYSMRTMEVSFVSEYWANEPASILAKWGMV